MEAWPSASVALTTAKLDQVGGVAVRRSSEYAVAICTPPGAMAGCVKLLQLTSTRRRAGSQSANSLSAASTASPLE
ncbi:MAG: hypothetical protein QM767_27355 [Anaeromyxobacter sp.]